MVDLRKTVNYDSLVSKYGESLVNQEIDLELESKQLAKERFLHDLYAQNRDKGNKLKERKQNQLKGTTGTLLKECIPVFQKGLEDYFQSVDNGKPGKRHIICSLFRELQPDYIAYVATKAILSHSIGSNSPRVSLTAICKKVGEDMEAEVRFNRIFLSLEKDREKQVKSGLSKRVGLSYREAFMRAQEKDLIEIGVLDTWKKWTDEQRIQVGLKLIEIFISSTRLARLQKASKGDGKGFYYLFVFSEMMTEYVNHNDEMLADLAFKFRPMVIPPKPWTTPYDGGYYINLRKQPCLIKDSRKDVAEIYRDVDMPNVYKAVNAIQGTAWRINRRVLDVAQEILGWISIPEGIGVPSKYPEEKPPRPAEADTDEQVSKEWRVSMVHYYSRQASLRGKRILADALVALADTYKDFEAVYFPHNLDFRGRVYPMTTLSPQGCDLSKGLLEFSEGISLGEHGAMWLAFQGANCYGLDKKPMQERLEWVYSNTDMILSIAQNPLDDLRWADTDSPWEFLAFCFEWADYLAKGELFVSHLPVAFDGSCSGLQHFSAMLKDEIGGKAVNLVPSDQVQDIYKIVADKVTGYLKEDAHNGSQDAIETLEDGNQYLLKGTSSMAQEWLSYGVTRKVTKRSTMTLCYGSKQYGFAEQVLEDTILPAIAKNPVAFSKPQQSARYMAALIWKALGDVVVKAVEAMDWLQIVSGLLANDRDSKGNSMPVTWVTPAGFPVRQKYPKMKMKNINTVLVGSISVLEPFGDTKELTKGTKLNTSIQVPDGNKLDTRKQRQGIAPNFVHSMDASHLMLTVDACVDKGINAFAMIHDSYGTHAGKADILYQTVREVFVNTYTEHDVLQELHDHVANQLCPKNLKDLPEIPSKGNLDLDLVLESLYAFS